MSDRTSSETIPEMPALSETSDSLGACATWKSCRATTLDEVSDILDHLENLRIRETQLDRRGHRDFEIRWR